MLLRIVHQGRHLERGVLVGGRERDDVAHSPTTGRHLEKGVFAGGGRNVMLFSNSPMCGLVECMPAHTMQHAPDDARG